MSRAFVKEDDQAETPLPDRPQSAHPNYLTPTGLVQLQQRLQQLETQRRDLLPQKERAHQQIASLERDIRYVTGRINSAIPVAPATTPPSTVLFGACVELEAEDGTRYRYHLVGEDEADIQQFKISWVSPLARALMGLRVGETVIWERPAGNLLLEIISIQSA